MTSSTPASESPTAPIQPENVPVGPWRVLGVLACVANFFLTFSAAGGTKMPLSVLSGYVLGSAIIWPVIVVLAFRIWKKFRNRRSGWKIFFWTSLLFCFSALMTVVRNVVPPS